LFRGEYKNLCSWVHFLSYSVFGVNPDNLDRQLAKDLERFVMTRDLFAVGMSPLNVEHIAAIDEGLRKARDSGCYLGLITLVSLLAPSGFPLCTDIGSQLHLSVGAELKHGGRCRGWLGGTDTFRALGLEPI
jgi:hypothetical protein